MQVLIRGVIAAAVMSFAFTAYAQTGGGAPSGAAAAATAVKNPVPSTPASITAGAATFKKYCSFCHGPEAKGNGPLAPKDSNPPSLVDATWIYGPTDADIFNIISNGTAPKKTVMLGFKASIPEEDRWNVINFLRSLGPKNAVR